VVTFDAQLSKGIQPHDLLSIYVESETPESTKQYDQDTDKIAVEDGAVIVGTGASAVSGYLVSAEGSIIFPVLGELHVVGMTHDSLAHYIEHRLVQERHIKNPRVTVKLINFKKGVIIKDID
jgi:polysaccharide export outer membrane protein